jgi:hypothetical protein
LNLVAAPVFAGAFQSRRRLAAAVRHDAHVARQQLGKGIKIA